MQFSWNLWKIYKVCILYTVDLEKNSKNFTRKNCEKMRLREWEYKKYTKVLCRVKILLNRKILKCKKLRKIIKKNNKIWEKFSTFLNFSKCKKRYIHLYQCMHETCIYRYIFTKFYYKFWYQFFSLVVFK